MQTTVMDKPVLTIGIPTYNGDRFIDGTLSAVTDALAVVPVGLVEVLISDNASTDRTPSIVARYCRQHPSLMRYHRNETNLGFDKNVDVVFRVARGRFVLLLGDDDYPCQTSSIQRLLEFLAKCEEESIIHIGYRYLDLETSNTFDGTHYTADAFGLDVNGFFSATGYVATTLSSLVFRREAWLSVDVEPFIGTSWIQVGVMVRLLGGGGRAAILSDHLTVVRISNSRWVENFGNYADLKLRLFSIIRLLGAQRRSREAYRRLRAHYYAENLKIFRAECRSSIPRKIHLVGNGVLLFGLRPSFWFLHVPGILISDGTWNKLGQLRKLLARRLKAMIRQRVE